MGTVIQFPKKEKESPRGPRGAVKITIGQTWCKIHNGEKVVVRKYEADRRGQLRVWFSRKFSRGYWSDVAERTFRNNHKEESEYRTFVGELREEMQDTLDKLGVSDGMYKFFNVECATPSERKLGPREIPPEPPPQPIPKKGEMWRSNYNGYIIEILKRSYNDGELWIQFKGESIPWGSMSYLERFKGKWARVEAA